MLNFALFVFNVFYAITYTQKKTNKICYWFITRKPITSVLTLAYHLPPVLSRFFHLVFLSFIHIILYQHVYLLTCKVYDWLDTTYEQEHAYDAHRFSDKYIHIFAHVIICVFISITFHIFSSSYKTFKNIWNMDLYPVCLELSFVIYWDFS